MNWNTFHSTHVTTHYMFVQCDLSKLGWWLQHPTNIAQTVFPIFRENPENFHQNVLHVSFPQHFCYRFHRKYWIFTVDEHKITFDLFLYLADRKYTAIKTVHKKEEVGVEFSHDTFECHGTVPIAPPHGLSNRTKNVRVHGWRGCHLVGEFRFFFSSSVFLVEFRFAILFQLQYICNNRTMFSCLSF